MSNFTNAKIVPCTQAEYFAINAISRSQIVDAWMCPQKYLRKQEKPIVPTAAMKFGTMVDELALEGMEPLRDALIVPVEACVTAKGDVAASPKATKVWKERAKEAGKLGLDIYLDHEAAALIQRVKSCAAAVLNEWPDMAQSNGAKNQVVIVATFTETGQAVKCRLDSLLDSGVKDLKVTEDASYNGFIKKVRKFAYHIQDAIYRDMVSALTGADDTPFAFACVEPEGDHLCGEWTIHPEWTDAGRDIYERTLHNMAGYAQTGWPTSYGKGELQPKSYDLED